jgi:hypothetical protein
LFSENFLRTRLKPLAVHGASASLNPPVHRIGRQLPQNPRNNLPHFLDGCASNKEIIVITLTCDENVRRYAQAKNRMKVYPLRTEGYAAAMALFPQANGLKIGDRVLPGLHSQ